MNNCFNCNAILKLKDPDYWLIGCDCEFPTNIWDDGSEMHFYIKNENNIYVIKAYYNDLKIWSFISKDNTKFLFETKLNINLINKRKIRKILQTMALI